MKAGAEHIKGEREMAVQTRTPFIQGERERWCTEEYIHTKKKLELINKFNKFARLHYQYTKTNSMSIYQQDTQLENKKKKENNSIEGTQTTE